MAAIIVKVKGRPEYLGLLRRAVLELPFIYAQRACAIERTLTDRWALAIYEAATNIVRHAYQGFSDSQIRLEIEPLSDRVEFALFHEGKAFCSLPPEERAELGEGGYGLAIIHAVMQEVTAMNLEEGGAVLRMKAPLPQGCSDAP